MAKTSKLACNHCGESVADSKSRCPVKDCDAVFCANGKCQLTKWTMCLEHQQQYAMDGEESFEAPCVDCGKMCSIGREKCEREACPNPLCYDCFKDGLCGRCAKLSGRVI